MEKTVWDLWEPFTRMASMPTGAETMEEAVRLLYPIDGHRPTGPELASASKLANEARDQGGSAWDALTYAIVAHVAGQRLLL